MKTRTRTEHLEKNIEKHFKEAEKLFTDYRVIEPTREHMRKAAYLMKEYLCSTNGDDEKINRGFDYLFMLNQLNGVIAKAEKASHSRAKTRGIYLP